MDLPPHPFHYTDAATYGLSPRQLRDAVAAGSVRRLLRGVYADARLPDDVRLRARAAALVLPRNAVVCDRSAAWIHGVELFDPGQLTAAPLLEVVTPCEASLLARNGTSGARRDLDAGDVMLVEGVRVTTPLRTLCDLGRLRGRRKAFASICMMASVCGITAEAVEAVLPRYRGKRGVIQLRELVAIMTARCESHREAETLLEILDAGLPRPDMQVVIDLPDYGRVRLDFAYRLIRVAVEYDGEEWHSSPEQRAADEARRAALRAAGWIVIVVRREQLRGPGLDAWLSELRHHLTEARASQQRVYARAHRESGRRRPS